MLSPRLFFSIYWGILLTIGTIFSSKSVLAGIIIIIGFIATFYLGGSTVYILKKTSNSNNNVCLKDNIQNPITQPLIIILFISSFVYIFGLVYFISLSYPITKITELISLYTNISFYRYQQTYHIPVYVTFFLSFVYLSALTAGILLKEDKVKLSVIGILPAIIIFLITTEKLVLLSSTLFFACSYFCYNCTKAFILSKKQIIQVIICFLILMFIGLKVRLLNSSMHLTELLYVNFFSFLDAFSYAVKAIDHEYTFGKYTFSGLYNLLNFANRDIGIISAYHELNNGLKTNIYTGFFLLISDFSLIGAYLLIFLAGVISERIYLKYLEGNKKSLAPLIFIYSGIVLSHSTIIFTYNSFIMAFILFYFLTIYSIGHGRKER